MLLALLLLAKPPKLGVVDGAAAPPPPPAFRPPNVDVPIALEPNAGGAVEFGAVEPPPKMGATVAVLPNVDSAFVAELPKTGAFPLVMLLVLLLLALPNIAVVAPPPRLVLPKIGAGAACAACPVLAALPNIGGAAVDVEAAEFEPNIGDAAAVLLLPNTGAVVLLLAAPNAFGALCCCCCTGAANVLMLVAA